MFYCFNVTYLSVPWVCHGNEDDELLQHFHSLERITCYFSPLQLQMRNRNRCEETWPWPYNKRKVQPKIRSDLLCLRYLLILGNTTKTTETPRGNTWSFLDVPILCPISACHLLHMLARNSLVKLFLHDLHGCQLHMGKLSQRHGGDYVRTGNLCFVLCQSGFYGSCHQLIIMLLHPVMALYHSNR